MELAVEHYEKAASSLQAVISKLGDESSPVMDKKGKTECAASSHSSEPKHAQKDDLLSLLDEVKQKTAECTSPESQATELDCTSGATVAEEFAKPSETSSPVRNLGVFGRANEPNQTQASTGSDATARNLRVLGRATNNEVSTSGKRESTSQNGS